MRKQAGTPAAGSQWAGSSRADQHPDANVWSAPRAQSNTQGESQPGTPQPSWRAGASGESAAPYEHPAAEASFAQENAQYRDTQYGNTQYSETHRDHTYPYSDDRGEADTYPPLWRVLLTEGLQVIVPAMILALLVHLFLAQATVVYGQSMEPNLHENERLIIDKLSYQLRAPQRHDIVVLDLPHMEELLVKRVIGLPGELVEIRHGEVFVNGEPIAEPFPHDLGFQSSPPVILGPLTYFVLGDNRENSNDSRAFGPIRRDTIVGRVWLRYWPLNQLKAF